MDLVCLRGISTVRRSAQHWRTLRRETRKVIDHAAAAFPSMRESGSRRRPFQQAGEAVVMGAAAISRAAAKRFDLRTRSGSGAVTPWYSLAPTWISVPLVPPGAVGSHPLSNDHGRLRHDDVPSAGASPLLIRWLQVQVLNGPPSEERTPHGPLFCISRFAQRGLLHARWWELRSSGALLKPSAERGSHSSRLASASARSSSSVSASRSAQARAYSRSKSGP